MSKTYLELVNRCIDECKISLDPLTSSNFANPPNSAMYDRVKRWVDDAYEELLTTRNEWFWRQERGNIRLFPRLQLSSAIIPPAIGYTYRGVSSGVSFTVKAVYTYEDVEGDAGAEYTVDVIYLNNSVFTDLIQGETLDVTSPAPTSGAAVLKGQGFYKFSANIPQIEQIDENSLYIFPPVPTTPAPYAGYGNSNLNPNGTPVRYLNWSTFWSRGLATNTNATPYFYTRTNQGTYTFIPTISEELLLELSYTRVIPHLVNYDDVPEALPAKYHWYLMWRAARSFSDFDGNGKLYSRFKKEEDRYMLWMERDESPKVTMGSDKFRVR